MMKDGEALKILNEAFRLLCVSAEDAGSWLCSRMKSANNVSLTDQARISLRIDLESRFMGLLLEALKSKDVKKTETKGE